MQVPILLTFGVKSIRVMKTILVATDYSAAANNAVDYAAQLASKTGAELVLFHVYKVSVHVSNSLGSFASIEKLVKKSEERLNEYAIEISKRYGIKVRYELMRDDTILGLKKYTREHLVDLVVMGIESNRIEYKWFGNTTTEAIKLMQFPLLVVPNDIQFSGIHKIMYACESSYLKDGCELNWLKDFVRGVEADLEVFHVQTKSTDTEVNAELERVMNKALHDIDHTFNYVSNPKVDAGIAEGFEKFPADLLVMIPHKIGFLESFYTEGHTIQVTVKTRVPLLVIPNEKAC